MVVALGVENKMQSNRISKKGQITIPIELRRKLRLRSGTLMKWREENGHLVLTSVRRLLDEIQGSLKPLQGQPSAFDLLFEERKREGMREQSQAND